MLFTLAAVIFFAALCVFFSQEFIRTFKRIFAIKGAKLFIPLALASWLVYQFDYWGLWAIYYLRELLHSLLMHLTRSIPLQQWAHSIALIVLLTIISTVPVFLLDAFLRWRTYKSYAYSYLTSALIWIICSVLLTLPLS